MRHFVPLALTPGVLPGGMPKRTPAAELIPPPGRAQRLAPPDGRAISGAVHVAVIALPADGDLTVTTHAVVEPVSVLDHPVPGRRRTGQRSGIAASWESGTSTPR